jgi:hypothetical protein
MYGLEPTDAIKALLFFLGILFISFILADTFQILLDFLLK